MKRMFVAFLLVLVMASGAFFPACVENERATHKQFDPSDYLGANCMVDSSNDFAFEMYAHIASGNENVFLSPYSISTALGMAYEGAGGQTAEEIRAVLDLPLEDQERWNMTLAIQSAINRDHDSYQLSTANAYWLRSGESLNSQYEDVIRSYYLAHGESLNFIGDPSGSRDTINSWVEERTNDRIKDLLHDGDITSDTYLILTNAVYFKANWKYQFDKNATGQQPFTRSDGSAAPVDMMNMCDESRKLGYTANDDVQLLRLPYKDNELSMYILLPKDNDIASVEKDLDHEYLNRLVNDLEPEWVDLHLPGFKFELRYGLGDTLSDMGMPTAFSSSADFSGIAGDGRGLRIDKVIHQSFVEVNEEGTEAAAATAVTMLDECIGGGSEPQPVEFNADHPFLFFIEQEETGQILFMGKVEDPNA